MFDRYDVSCPECETKIKEKIVPPTTIECRHCKKTFEVLGNRKSRRSVFIRLDSDRAAVHPLFLPAGSVRAFSTIIVSITCWILLVKGTEVPTYVFNLLLGIIGYYFAFRKGAEVEGVHLYEGREQKRKTPLLLPGGVIRSFLIGGFLVVSLALHQQGRIELQFMRFLVLLWGLIIGYFFAKAAKRLTGGKLTELINHAKALMVVLASICLFAVLMKTGPVDDHGPALTLAATISFYFGSKT